MSDPARTYDPRSVTITIDGHIVPQPPARGDYLAEIGRRLAARVVVREVADFGVDLSRYFGPAVSLGDRGCFHDGCAPSIFGEGGSCWCRFAEEPGP